MDGRMDLSAIERSRLLSSLPSSALGHLGLSALAVSEQSHSSALNRLSAASAAAAAGASPPDLARAGSPTAGLSQYPGRYMSSSALHSPGASYAMMAGYFGGSSHIPDSFKALMPEFQQYWGTSQEAYARQLLANMYYPYLPYLPATESLSLFAQNSATAAQVQAAAQAHAAHHRIYDLHKEALFGPGSIPGSFYPQSLLLPTQSSSQVEATNLSISGSNKSKYKDEKDKHKHLESEINKLNQSAKGSDTKSRLHDDDKTQTSDSSERTRGMGLKKSSDDHLKFRSSDGIKKSSTASATTSSYSVSKVEHEKKRSKLESVLRQGREGSDDPNTSRLKPYRIETQMTDKRRNDKLSSPVGYGEHFVPVSAFSPVRSSVFHSPSRNDRVISPDRRSSKAHSPGRSQKASSPIQLTDISLPVQEKPENLCVKDRKGNTKDVAKPEKHKSTVSNLDSVAVKTQSIITGTTVTVSSTLNVITSDLPLPQPNKKAGRETESSPRHLSPSLSSPSSASTSTTYSLPYYHNLYSRSQSNSQDGKKVHAVTYVPEIGTVQSPFANSPPAIDTKSQSENEHRTPHKHQTTDSPNDSDDLAKDKADATNSDALIVKSSPTNSQIGEDDKLGKRENKLDPNMKEENRQPDVCIEQKAKEDDFSVSLEIKQTMKTSDHSCQNGEKFSVQRTCLEQLKRRKSVSPQSSSTSKTIDLTSEKNGDMNKSDYKSPKSRNVDSADTSMNTRKADTESKHKTSAIINKTYTCSPKVSENSCDMNHNSKGETSVCVSSTDIKKFNKPIQTEPGSTQEVSNKTNLVETEKTSRSSSNSVEKSLPDKTSNATIVESDIKKPEKCDAAKGACKDEKLSKSKEIEKGPKEKRDHGPLQGSTIPVGIAVARQRNIAPKIDKDHPKTGTEDVRGKVAAAAEIKPVRPLKIIRPSSKGKTPGTTDFRNELPANLIVTGGSNNNGGLFWSNDQASRQLAAQYLPASNQINQTSWYDQSHLTFPSTNQPTTTEGTQLPFSVQPGFKLAQDSLTGGILLIPSATDVYDSSRIFSSYPVGTPNTQNFGTSLLTTPQTQSNIPAAGATFINQPSLNGSAHFHAPFGTEVLPRPEAPVKEEKCEINSQHNTESIITSSVGLTTGQDNGSVSVVVHQEIDKDKIMTVPPPSFVTAENIDCRDSTELLVSSVESPHSMFSDLSLTTGQQCAYTFHPPAMPYIFNPSVLPVHNIPEPTTEVPQTKLEHTSVQSRGTSPMLPATDSSNEENEDCVSTHDDKIEKLDEKTEEVVSEHEEQECKTLHEANLTSDCKEEKISDPVPDSDLLVDSNTEHVSGVKVKNEVVDIGRKFVHSDCDIKVCDVSEHKSEVKPQKVVPVDSNKSQSKKSFSVEETASEIPENKTDERENPQIVVSLQTAEKTDINTEKEIVIKPCRTSKSDRNIFSDLTEYNPFTDPQILEAADGLELLSTLAEKSSLCSNMNPAETNLTEKPEDDTATEDVYTFKEDKISTSKSLHENADSEKETIVKSPKETKKLTKSRIKCGYAFKPSKTPEPTQTSPVRMTTFCGITIPEDDDVIDSIEMEMKMRLMELQRRYREKQKELTKLKPKKERDKMKDEEREKETVSETDKIGDFKRGRGRPKKRKNELEENNVVNRESQSPKAKTVKKEITTPNKSLQNGRHSKLHTNHTGSAHGSLNSSNGTHGSNKKKKLAEMLVDRVFRKAGSSFKIPLSKKISLIAPARIELPGTSNNSTEKSEPSHVKKSLDFRRLIKRSRLSQLNGKDRSFDGGLWKRKEEKRKEKEEKKKHSRSSSLEEKQKKPKKQEVESGLGLLAEYATKYREEKDKEKDKEKEKEKSEKIKKKRKTEEEANLSSPESPNKKRKPGRPKKCDLIQPGVTETIVAKQSKHIDFFRWQKDDKPDRKISLEGKAPLKPLYLDEWNVRRSERIFLSDSSPQTSPNNTSPGVKQKQDEKDKSKDKERKDKDKGMEKDNGKDSNVKDSNKQRAEPTKKQKSTNLQDISQKLKKKYSTTFSQKSKDKTSELLKARDKLTKKRHSKKLKKLSKSNSKTDSESDASTDDIPLSSLKNETDEKGFPSCIIDKDELQDGLRILIFMDGLFHEGEVKAIRPPDVYGAILDNERRTRPHICSQEEILRDAIKDVKPNLTKHLKEGTRVCAYWSQQFSCLYPGTVSRASPDPHADKSLVNVEFDDGDNGKIPLDHIRLIPQDFPIVEYDPHPLLLLTKRRRTLSTSESSEPRISCSNIPPSPKENKATVKRGPGRPPKADRLMSEESVGDEDVFSNGTATDDKDDEDDNKSETSEKGSSKKQKNKQTVPNTSPRQLWKWSGSSTKRPGLKGKARKEYYKCIVRGRENISVGECAVFLSTGRPNLPYVGRIESLWESWGGQMVVKVKWFYHPEETKGGRRLQNMKGALFRSDHEDENDVQTISHKCEVLKYEEFRRRKTVISLDENSDVYYLAGSYQPTIGHIKFEPGVI